MNTCTRRAYKNHCRMCLADSLDLHTRHLKSKQQIAFVSYIMVTYCCIMYKPCVPLHHVSSGVRYLLFLVVFLLNR